MPTTSAATSRRKLPLVLGLALLTVAAVAIPAVAIARSDPRGPPQADAPWQHTTQAHTKACVSRTNSRKCDA
jgi:invasion protein IalB